ncbi:NAD(P)-binding protein [Xylariaceae sp. FL0662B]|nr:NAD(P)-binding protein [Xylariaceae sp. FL0662B]
MAKFTRDTEGLELVHKFANQVRGRTFLLTGPTPGGLGAESVISLAAESPAMIILVGRSLTKAQPTIDAIKGVDSSIKVKFVEVDLASLRSVRKGAQAILDDSEITHIDVFINNAAVMACPFKRTEDGFEYQFAANHLGHFVLTNKIMPKILAALRSDRPAPRLVFVASSGHRYTGLRLSDPNFTEPGSYSPINAYGQSKTAMILYAVSLNRRLGSHGIRTYTLHPGGAATGLQAHAQALTGEQALALFEDASQRINGCSLAESRARDPWKTLQQGCATTVRAALDPDLVREKGVYLEHCNLTMDPKLIKDWATDPELAEKGWALSEELVGEKFDI